MRNALRHWLLATWFGVCCLAQAAETKRVLWLLPVDSSQRTYTEVFQGMSGYVEAALPSKVEYRTESLRSRPNEIDWLWAKHKGQQFDLIVSLTTHPLDAAVEFRRRMGKSIPILLIYNPTEEEPQLGGAADIVRLLFQSSPLPALDVALRLFPETKTVVVISGSHSGDVKIHKEAMEMFRKQRAGVRFVDLSGLTMAQWKERILDQPPESICLLLSVTEDAAGFPATQLGLTKVLSEDAPMPIFGRTAQAVGNGAVGGIVFSGKVVGLEIGKIVLRLLQNEAPAKIGMIERSPEEVRFDGRQLKRWGVPESRLPPGSIVENQEPTVWERYRTAFLVTIGAVGTLLALLLFLLLRSWRRERSLSEFKERVSFDAILGQAVLSMTNRTSVRRNDSILEMLENLRQLLQADITGLIVYRSVDDQVIRQAFFAPPLTPVPEPHDFPYVTQQLQMGHDVLLPDVAALPAGGAQDMASFAKFGVVSMFAAPLAITAEASGSILVANRNIRNWPKDLIARVRSVGRSAASSWAHQMAMGETLSQSIVDSFEGHVVAIDSAGLIRHAKVSQLVTENRFNFGPARIGAPYATIWEGFSDYIAPLLRSLQQVLDGDKPEAEVEIRLQTPFGDVWIAVYVQPLRHPGGGAVITHLDITARKREELAGAQDLDRVSHWNRVSALGELASSLAHEVNQPLSAIGSNAAVAMTILDATQPDVVELKEVLRDIQDDGKRAAAVIRDMRALLKKSPPKTREQVDVAEVIRDTVRLVNNDAISRRVGIDWTPPENPIPLHMERTQLQQVLLNLFRNALDAAESVPEGQRWVRVRTELRPETVLIVVEDSGPGVPAELRTRIFEPFFTTKPEGLGVGLAISRSIVLAAGGQLTLDEQDGGGARFCVALPHG